MHMYAWNRNHHPCVCLLAESFFIFTRFPFICQNRFMLRAFWLMLVPLGALGDDLGANLSLCVSILSQNFFNIASRCANIEPRFVKVYLRSHLGANILQNVSQIPLPSTAKSQKTIKNHCFFYVFCDPAFVLKCAEITPYKPPRPHKMSSRWSSWRQLGPRSLQVEAS